MNCTSIRGIARSGDSGNNSLQKDYARKSAKAPTNIYLHFFTPDEIKRFGKDLDVWLTLCTSYSQKFWPCR